MKTLISLCTILLLCHVTIAQERKEFDLTFNHMALSVKDVNASADFYTKVLNLEPIPLPPNITNVRWISLGEGKQLHLISIFDDEIKTNKALHLALSVSDFDAFVDSLKKMSVAYSDFPGNLNQINIRPDGIQQIYFQDPDGYWIEVNSVKD